MSKFVVTATADFAGFTEGQKLSTPGEIASYHRALVNMERDTAEHTTLTDVQIVACVMSVQGDNAEAESKRLEALEALEDASDLDAMDDADKTDAVPAKGDDVPAEKESEVKAEAIRAAHKGAGSDVLQSEFSALIAAGKKLKQGPLSLLLILQKVYTSEDMASWPRPGTSWRTRAPGSNEVVDKRRIFVTTKNGRKPSTVGFYDLMFRAMPVGKALSDKIEAIDDAEAKRNEWLKEKPHDRAAERKSAVGDQTQGRSLLRRAVRLGLQFQACEGLQGITVYWAKDKNGTPKDTRYPIMIRDDAGDGSASPFSIDQFLGFDPSYAKDAGNVAKEGGVYEALVASGGSGEPETPTNNAPMDIELFIAETGMMCGYHEEVEHGATIRKQLLKKDEHGKRAFLVSYVELHDAMHEYASDPEIRKAYQQEVGTVTKSSKAA